MKKKILTVISLILPSYIFAQWGTSGNTGASGQWLGTNNAFPLVIRTNNTERASFSSAGLFKINGLSGTGTGLMTVNSTGEVIRFNLGTSSQVLTGNGAWTNISTATGWTLGTGIITTPNKIGIGVTAGLTKALEVNGDAIFSGSVYATNFVLSDVTLVQGHLAFQTQMFLNGYDAIAGTRNELYTNSQPYYIQSALGV